MEGKRLDFLITEFITTGPFNNEKFIRVSGSSKKS